MTHETDLKNLAEQKEKEWRDIQQLRLVQIWFIWIDVNMYDDIRHPGLDMNINCVGLHTHTHHIVMI